MNKQDWTYKKLGEVGTFQRGKGIKRADFVETGMPCIHYGQIHTSFGVSTNRHLSSISSELFEQSIKASHGDIIIALTSEDVEGSCKATAWLGNYDIAISSDAAIFRHNLNSKYISYYLRSKSFFVEKSKYARGFKVTHIKTSEIAEIGIPVPPIEEQERIVAELDLLSGIIEKKKEQLKAYDQLAQSIFYTMFGDPIDNPKGWETKKLGEVCTFTQGIQVPVEEQHKVKREGDIQFLRIIDFTQGKEEPRYVTNKNDKYVLHEREIAIVRYGTPGFICYGKNGAIANNLFKITPNQNDMFDFYFMLYWLRSDAFQASVKNKQYGAALQAIKFSTIQGIGIILPPLSLQEEFAEKVEAIERQKALVQQSIVETQTMFDCTMDKYFG